MVLYSETFILRYYLPYELILNIQEYNDVHYFKLHKEKLKETFVKIKNNY